MDYQGLVSAISAAVTTILTGIYVVATIRLVRVSHEQAKLGYESINALREAERNRTRPYVIFDITYDGVIAFAVLKNTGISPALNVRISIEPTLKWRGDEDGVGFIDHGVAFLAPNREISEPCGAGMEFRNDFPDLKFRGFVKYSDGKNAYEEPFAIDLNFASRMKSIGTRNTADELARVADALKVIVSDDFHPLVRILREEDYAVYCENLAKRKSAAAFERLRRMASMKGSKESQGGDKAPTAVETAPASATGTPPAAPDSNLREEPTNAAAIASEKEQAVSHEPKDGMGATHSPSEGNIADKE